MNGSRGIGKTTLHLKLRYAGIITVVGFELRYMVACVSELATFTQRDLFQLA